MRHQIKALIATSVVGLLTLGAASAPQTIPLAVVKSDIEAAATTRVNKGLLEGLSTLIVREVMPYSVSVGTNPLGDIVFELNTTVKTYTAVSFESAIRIQEALMKGDEWCSIVESEGVDARKLIDGWDTTGTQVNGIQAGKAAKTRVEIWIDTSGAGKYCFVGFSGKAGYQSTRFLLPRSSLKDVHDAIDGIQEAAAVLRSKVSHDLGAVESLK